MPKIERAPPRTLLDGTRLHRLTKEDLIRLVLKLDRELDDLKDEAAGTRSLQLRIGQLGGEITGLRSAIHIILEKGGFRA